MRFLRCAFAISILVPVLALNAGTLNVTFNQIPAGTAVNLTTNGVLDWVHWGLITETSVDRKAGVTPRISNFTPVDASNGYVYIYQFADNANGYTWSDGTPHMGVTNTPTGVWAYGIPAIGSGFRITVPAETNLQTLKVYVGAFSARGKFVAMLSDQSAATYTNPMNSAVENIGNGPSAVYTINFAAGSTGQTLTVIYTLDSLRGGADGNVTLQAAALSSPGANNIPFVALTSPNEGASVALPTNVLLTATASDVDGSIQRVEFYAGTNLIGEATAAPYNITWTNPPAGQYLVTARAVDDTGAVGISMAKTLFVSGAGGSLTASRSLAPTTADLTAEGSSDWAHWGLLTASSFNHKASGSGQISDFTRIGTNAITRFTDNRTAFSWNDGTPVSAVANTNAGVYITGLTNGFQFTVPADTNVRTLRVYTGLYGARGNFQAWLSDFSGAAFTDTTVSNIFGTTHSVYSLTYAAASSNQQLVIRYTTHEVFDAIYGNVSLQAATLEGAAPVSNAPPVVSIVSPTNGAVLSSAAIITIQADAFDSDGSVTNVDFLGNEALLGSAAVAPFSVTVSNLSPGTHVFTARALDNLGAATLSSPITVVVTNSPPPAPVLVNVQLQASDFVFSFATQPGSGYAVEATPSLHPIAWETVTNFVADGTSFSLTNNATAEQRFYRVKAE